MTCVLGVDVQSVSEIEESLEQFGDRYLEVVYDSRERAYVRSHPHCAGRYLAGRFAGREAVLKLLEATDAVATWSNIQLGNGVTSPRVHLDGRAQEIADTRGISSVLMSITVTRSAATAIAIADVQSC